jgi:hypothetical protein
MTGTQIKSRVRAAVLLGAGVASCLGSCTSGSGADDRGAAEAYMDKLPDALCKHYQRCGFTEDVAKCVSDLTQEVGATRGCDGWTQFYGANKRSLEACLDGSQGSCDSDDVAAFCPEFAKIDVEKTCQPAAKDAGVGGDVARAPLPAQEAAVGAWTGGATCGGQSVTFGYLLCPAGRLRGFEKLGKFDFVDCGTWTVSGSRLTAKYTATPTADPSAKQSVTYQFDYSDNADTLKWVSQCAVTLKRLAGGVTEADCTSSTCTAGGSGPVTCEIDCDCGRCWYCDQGTCRYGGEGPYGCYRGCGP